MEPEELKASKAGGASAPSSAGAASEPSAPVQAERKPAVEPTRPAEPAGTAKLEAGATFKAPTKAGPATKPESKQMPRPYAKPSPKVKALDSDDKLQKVVYLFLTRVYSVFRPEKLPQVGELLAKYDLKLKNFVGAVAAKYLTKDSAENLLMDLVRGVTRRRHGVGLEHGA